ncbi:replication protein [Pectobacterium brasiliense]|uniref:replication protein n=1 Tax=Pectobacterium brasiliense TaxID=180957 RepID=UPI000CE69609|nr:replication protein [Pectobacterium brasiliense]
MENQRNGYIPLYRSIRKKPWAKDVYLRTLWENLLMDAARKPYTANFKGHTWQLQPGQLVTTSDDLGLLLCDRSAKPTSRHAVERMLAFFQKEEMISVSTVHRKGTLITILNYSEYAEKIDNLPAHNDAHNDAHNKPSNGAALSGVPAHNDAHYPAHHEQEGNNKNIKPFTSENSNESPDTPPKKLPVVRPDAAIQSGNKWGTSDDLRCAEWMFNAVLNIAPSAKKPQFAGWANDIRLMRERDGRTHRDMCSLFKWATQDSFWCGNVLCPATLREKWDKLDIKRNKQQSGTAAGKPVIDFDNTDWINGVSV